MRLGEVEVSLGEIRVAGREIFAGQISLGGCQVR